MEKRAITPKWLHRLKRKFHQRYISSCWTLLALVVEGILLDITYFFEIFKNDGYRVWYEFKLSYTSRSIVKEHYQPNYMTNTMYFHFVLSISFSPLATSLQHLCMEFSYHNSYRILKGQNHDACRSDLKSSYTGYPI